MVFLWCSFSVLYSQSVLISDDPAYTTPNGSAVLELYSKSRGLLIPRMTTAQRTGITSPVAGLMVYDTDEGDYYIYTTSGWQLMQEGFWLYNSSTKTIYLADNNAKVGIGTSTPTARLEVHADASASRSDPLFEVKNTKGQTVFAVYDNGVRIYIDTTEAKAGSPGGFAIRGMAGTKATRDYMWVTPDSIRFYIDTAAVTAGSPGGFAIKGIADAAKGLGNEEYLRVTRDSTRVYVNTAQTKAGSPGGFAIKGLAGTKGINDTRFLHLVPENYFIGHQSGINITSGRYNSILGYQAGKELTKGCNNTFLGYQAGLNDTTGTDNTFIGYQAGLSNTSGEQNIFIGKNAGASTLEGNANILIGNNVADSTTFIGSCNILMGINTACNPNFLGTANVMIGNDVDVNAGSNTRNVFIGDQVAQGNTTGSYNVYIGARSGMGTDTANNNIFLGYESGFKNAYGSYNLFLGYRSGHENIKGTNNMFIGYEAGFSDTSGSFNTFIGYQAGFSNENGDYNLFLGYKSGYSNTSGTNNMFIGTDAGASNTTGSDNTFIGWAAGYKNINGYDNLFIGTEAGSNNTVGYSNLFLGTQAGSNNTSGIGNCFLGTEAGYNNTTGSYNLFIGLNAGNGNQTGNGNIAMGYDSGTNLNGDGNILIGNFSGTNMEAAYENIVIGSDAAKNLVNGMHNVIIGNEAGLNNTNGINNVFIGYQAGGQELGSNKLYIDCSDTLQPLIYGNFADDSLKIFGTLGIGNEYSFPTNAGAPGQFLQLTPWGELDWVDIDGESTNASNGLSMSGDDVQLGGVLLFDTEIRQENYSMTYNLTGTGDFEIQDAGNSALFVQDDGKVAIGTNSPASNTKLHVLLSGTPLASQYAGTVAAFQQNANAGDWSRVSIIGGNAGASVLDFGDDSQQDVGYIKYDHDQNAMAFQTDGTERVTIDNRGNVSLLTGDLLLSAGTNGGEINRDQTGSANLVPIAYGNISSGGTVNTSTGNISVTHSSTGVYEINISGESYSSTDYITTVTLVTSGAYTASASDVNNHLLVTIKDAAGNNVDATFNFVVYKP